MQNKKFTKYVLAIQLFGALMFAVVCLAYIFGLPSDTVFHEELTYRVALGAFGSVFFFGSTVLVAVDYVIRNRVSKA